LDKGGIYAEEIIGAHVLAACVRINLPLEAFGSAPDRISLFFPFRYDVRILDNYLKKQMSSGLSQKDSWLEKFDERDNFILTKLIDIELPAVKDLEIKDIIAVRAGNGFSRWRDDLKDALSAASATPGDLSMNHAVQTRKMVREKLQASKEILENEFKEGKYNRMSRTGTTTLVTGAISATTAYLLKDYIAAADVPAFLATLGATASTAVVSTTFELTKIER
jgi:hypothetical protein